MAYVIKAIVVAVCLLESVQLVLCRASHKQKLCGDKNVKLHSINELLHTSTDNCSNHVKEAYGELVNLVKEPNVCTMDKVTGITRFYEKYLRGQLDGQAIDADSSRQIQALGKFAIAYGMQVSYVCRVILMLGFYGGAAQVLEDRDFEAVKEWTRDDSPIARLLGSIAKQGEFLVPADFLALAPEVLNKLKLRLTTSDKISQVQEVCKKRFRPLYGPLVLPIAHLERNGINYIHFFYASQQSLNQIVRNRFALWSRIVFLCESLKDWEVIEAPTGSPSEFIDVVNDRGDGNELEAKGKAAPISLEPVQSLEPFALISGKIDNDERHLKEASKYRLYSAADFKMKSAIRSFNATLTETDRFRNKLLGNKFGLMFATFKSNEQTRTLFKKAFKMAMNAHRESDNRQQDQELKSAERDLVSLLDAKKNSKFFKVLSKIARGGMVLLRTITLALEIVLLVALVIIPTLGSGIFEYLKDESVSGIPLKYTFGL